ncbi:LmeA family phospholipid-binding protein [Nonomuraea dietziae]|uniref:LmeA family phospholipid-binding protein n=1 Tax=Nonomuraea dietziae TaxID=65515 RepID=UPI0034270179
MRKLIIFLIVLIIVLVAVDRVAVAGVQRDIATRIAASSDLSGTPTVTIEGIPFLTQAIAGRYSEVRFDLGTLTYNTVKVDNLRGAAYDVTAPLADVVQNRAQITAGRVHVQGTLSRSTVDKFAPRGVKIGGSGDRLTASGEVDLGVTKVKFDAEMRVEVVDGGIKLTADKVNGIPSKNAGFLTYTIPFKGKLPFDVKVTGVKAVPAGLEITAEASDVPLRG